MIASRPDAVRGVVENERLTAVAGVLLLLLFGLELATALALRVLMPAHVFVGVALVGPLLLKLGSTGYRFARYYSGAVPYVRRGPPTLSLRILAIPLVATTIVLVGSGGLLLLTGPTQPGPLIPIHNISTFIWLPLVAVHLVGYLRRLPRLVAAASGPWRMVRQLGSRLPFGATIGAVAIGAVAAAIALPAADPWLGWAQSNDQVPAPIIVGAILTVVALAVARPLRWSSAESPHESPTT